MGEESIFRGVDAVHALEPGRRRLEALARPDPEPQFGLVGFGREFGPGLDGRVLAGVLRDRERYRDRR